MFLYGIKEANTILTRY